MSPDFRNFCQKRPNFLSQWEQLKVLTPQKRFFGPLPWDEFSRPIWYELVIDEFLITMRAIKSFDTILFVSSYLLISEILCHNKRPNFLSQWEQLKVLTPYFLCLHVFKFQKFSVTIKGQISYHKESNPKSWLYTFLSSYVLMKTHCEQKNNNG